MNPPAEQTLLLGPRQSMVGVITSAPEPVRQADAPFVVILNAGIIHRIGPNRLHVLMARALATAGFDVLRVDLSGLGDSEPRPDSLSPLDAALADIREVLDTLQASRQVQQVVLMGLCSGADHSVIYAGTDPRVAGVVLLDPSIPRTPRYYVQHYANRLLQMRPWLNLATGRHPLWRMFRRRNCQPVEAQLEPAPGEPPLTLEHPEVRAFLQNAYGRAVAQGVRLLAVMTADRERQHNYRRQLFDAFPQVPFGAQLRLEYFRHCDHTFTTRTNQQRLMGLVLEWMKTGWGGSVDRA